MSAGASGGADIEGRAFDAGPVGVNLADPQGTLSGLDQAREAQNAFNAALAAELEASPFSSLQEMEEFERSLFDPATMMAQKPVPGKQYNAIDFIEQFGPLTATTHNQTPWRGLSTEDAAYARAMSSMPSPTPPGLGLAVLGTALGLRNLTGDTPQRASTNYGMGVGGGPDAAQMSLDDFGINNALSQEESDVYNLDNAYAQVNLEPNYNYINPALEALAAKAAQETAQELGIGASISGLGVVGAMPAVKTGMDALLDFIDVDFGTHGPDIPGRAQDDVFEPSMNLQMEFGPVMDSDLEGVEGFLEAGGFQGGGSGVIGPDFDQGAVSEAGGEALQEALAQRAAETIIAQQAVRQVTPESNKVTIPTSSGPDIVIDVTPPAPQKVAPHRRTPPPPSPVKVAATSVAKPKAFKKLPKFAQKEIRKGKVPTGGSDYVQDMVREFLAPPKSVPKQGSQAWHDSGYGR